MHETVINELVSRFESNGIRFIRGTEVIEDTRCDLKYKPNIGAVIIVESCIADMEPKYLSVDGDYHAWLVFGKNIRPVWQIVIRQSTSIMTIQWRNNS